MSICKFQLNPTEETRISEMLDLLHIDLEIETKPEISLEAEEYMCSVSTDKQWNSDSILGDPHVCRFSFQS